MVESVESLLRYFIAIGGEQVGPFSETEVIQKIYREEIPIDALIWYEGLSDWQAVQAIPQFKEAFSGARSAIPTGQSFSSEGLAPEDPKAPFAQPAQFLEFKSVNATSEIRGNPDSKGNLQPTGQVLSGAEKKGVPPRIDRNESKESTSQPEAPTFASGQAEPVFSKAEASFAVSYWKRFQKQLIIAGSIVVIMAVSGYLFLSQGTNPTNPDLASSSKKKAEPKSALSREKVLSEAQSQLLTDSKSAVESMKKLALDKSDDRVGQEAIDAVVQYYRLRSPLEVGRFLVQVKRPTEAVDYFLKEHGAAQETHAAIEQALAVEKDSNKRRALILADLDLLVGPLSNSPLAVQRIQDFVKEYPAENNPYGYYLKTDEEKLIELFSRMSFLYSRKLSAYIESELPQVTLPTKPKVELRKEKSGNYRIAASYKGDVMLRQDHLTNINFEFWYVVDHWELVATNLTGERAKWTVARKEKFAGADKSPKELLGYLEQDIATQFPKTKLHEILSIQEDKLPDASQ